MRSDNAYHYYYKKGELITSIGYYDNGNLVFLNSFKAEDGSTFKVGLALDPIINNSYVQVEYVSSLSLTVSSFITNNKMYDAARDSLTFEYESGSRALYDSWADVNTTSNYLLSSSFELWNALLSIMGTNMNDVAFPSYSGI